MDTNIIIVVVIALCVGSLFIFPKSRSILLGVIGAVTTILVFNKVTKKYETVVTEEQDKLIKELESKVADLLKKKDSIKDVIETKKEIVAKIDGELDAIEKTINDTAPDDRTDAFTDKWNKRHS